MHLNIEIKARTQRLDEIRSILLSENPKIEGTDYQIDTYFFCESGRLKLRQGNIEKNLIFYRRPDRAGPKASEVFLSPVEEGLQLKSVLSEAYGIWKEVRKEREIYFIENVKFHLDKVDKLGTFVEIEAIDLEGNLGEDYLERQCRKYMKLFQIENKDLITQSYSDMLA